MRFFRYIRWLLASGERKIIPEANYRYKKLTGSKQNRIYSEQLVKGGTYN
jgi:hypothetical protein